MYVVYGVRAEACGECGERVVADDAVRCGDQEVYGYPQPKGHMFTSSHHLALSHLHSHILSLIVIIRRVSYPAGLSRPRSISL
jgi:hypothetical protein